MNDDKPMVQYAFWQEGDTPEDNGCWMFYDTLEEATREAPITVVEIYRFSGKRLGRFKMKTHPVRVKQRKRRKAK